MAICDHLMKQFWPTVEIQFHWWRTDFLADPVMANSAAEVAAAAHFVLFCPSEETEWSSAVSEWAESWASQRGNREGALVDLTEFASGLSTIAFQKASFLSKIARLAGMDYLTRAPWVAADSPADSFETLDLRATRITSVLDEILRREIPPHFRVEE